METEAQPKVQPKLPINSEESCWSEKLGYLC